MTGRRGLLLLVVAALAIGGGLWATGRIGGGSTSTTVGDGALPPGPPGGAPPGGTGGRRGAMGNDGPVPVLVAPVVREDVDVFVEGIGTVQADAVVTVRAQVEGRLLEVRFSEGQEVAAGDVLAVIDPASYRAVYDQATGKRDQNLAELANARADLERYERLAKSEAGSRQQADQQRATVAKLEAQTRIDQAVIDAAKIDLDNTTIRAPIAGRTGIRSVDVGNLVRSSDTTGLVTIARIRPIAVSFTVPSRELPGLLAAQARGAVPVAVLGADRRTVTETGAVTVIDNQVDSTTGTVKLKASLPNRETKLWPGQFVDLRVTVDRLAKVPVVPSPAIQRAAEGPWVYVVGDDGQARRRAVVVARQDETRAVIAEGLADGERVVTTGFARLTDGAKVRIDAGSAAPAPDTADKPAGAGARRATGEGRATGSGSGGPKP